MFLQRVRKVKEQEIKSLKIPFFKRKKPILNPLKFLRKSPVIAEVKRASPTKSRISNKNPLKVALEYEMGGAGAISVLTDKTFFNGGWDILKEVSENVRIPVLCKEFIISTLQLDMAYIMGADIVLLITSMLSDEELFNLSNYAKKIGLFVLMEIHAFEEFQRVKNIPFDMIGVNSRNLQTLKVDLKNAAGIIKKLPSSLFKVAESGIKNETDIKFLTEHGADAFLIGETLMLSGNPQELIRRFTDVYKSVRHNLR